MLSTWHGIPAKAWQVAPFCHSPATEFPQKRSRCHFLPSTCHGIPAKAFQVSFLPAHLTRNSCKSVPGVIFCLPPDTEFLQKRSRCHFLPSTCHGIPAKAFQVSFSAFHLARNSRESVPGVFPCRPPATVFSQKCARWHFMLSTWHSVPADVLAAGCNLNGEAPSFRPKPGRRKQGGEQAV